ncbi:MAG: 3-dehydroquinate synthase [Clostridia bacterium]|nr:3-dehydroquinate synthase [Clostridia bacterium]
MIKEIKVNPSYEVVIEKGVLKKAGELLNLDRKVLIVTDEGVPKQYAEEVKKQCKEGYIVTVMQGEDSKSITTFEALLKVMLLKGFTRKDAVVAVGGGVCGDLAGFTASCYMRGVDFYNIPTTLLSQVDSSVGGKTAVNLGDTKNIVGTFYQPKKVLIDSETLKTLPERQISCGMAEVIKMAACMDKEFFEFLETADFMENIEEIISKSVGLKGNIVQQDEKEKDLRKVLNFGHTIGHGVEVNTDLLHGEAVAVGMMLVSESPVKERLEKVLDKAGLKTDIEIDEELKKRIIEAMSHDKKTGNGKVSFVKIKEIGEFYFEDTDLDKLEEVF